VRHSMHSCCSIFDDVPPDARGELLDRQTARLNPEVAPPCRVERRRRPFPWDEAERFYGSLKRIFTLAKCYGLSRVPSVFFPCDALQSRLFAPRRPGCLLGCSRTPEQAKATLAPDGHGRVVRAIFETAKRPPAALSTVFGEGRAAARSSCRKPAISRGAESLFMLLAIKPRSYPATAHSPLPYPGPNGVYPMSDARRSR
jgi:hypothetical protein